MALRKQIELGNGVVANYFRITSLVLDKLRAEINVSLYLSKEQRDLGKSPVHAKILQHPEDGEIRQPKPFRFTLSSFEANAYQEAYAYLKTLSAFDGAEDC